MEQVLLVVHVIIAAALIGIVLLQRSETDGFGLGSGSGANLLSGRSAANLLTRTTAILAAAFIINSLVPSILASRHRDSVSVVDAIEQEQMKETFKAPTVPAVGADKKTVETKPAAPKKPKNVVPAEETDAE